MSLNSNVAGVSWACSFGNDDSLFVCRYTIIKSSTQKTPLGISNLKTGKSIKIFLKKAGKTNCILTIDKGLMPIMQFLIDIFQ